MKKRGIKLNIINKLKKAISRVNILITKDSKRVRPFQGSHPSKGKSIFYKLGVFASKAKLLYLEGFNSGHLKIRKIHDVTYAKGGTYKSWSDKPYSSNVHKASLVAFVASFLVFSVLQSVFPFFNLGRPTAVRAGTHSVTWSTYNHFTNNGAPGSNYTGATDQSNITINGSGTPDDAGAGSLTIDKLGKSDLSNPSTGIWTRRKPITINNFQPDLQTKITISYDSDMQADFDDIRFYDETARTELSYWIESKTDSLSAIVWFKTGSNNNVYLYYGNSLAVSSSNGGGTFEFFDDFEGNLSKWSNVGVGNITTTRAYRGGSSFEATSSQIQAYISKSFPSSFTNHIVDTYFYDTGSVSDPASVFTTSDTWLGVYATISTLNYSKRIGASWSSTSIPRTVGWHKITAQINSTGTSILLDGSLVFTNSSGTSVSTIILGNLWAGDNGIGSWDEITVRKYSSIEPTTLLGSEVPALPIPTPILSSLRINSQNIETNWSNVSWSSASLPANTKIVVNARTSNVVNPSSEGDWSAWSADFTQDLDGSTTGSGDLSSLSNSQWLDMKVTLVSEDGVGNPTLNDITVDYNNIDAPTNLTQYRTDTEASEITTGGWNNGTTTLKADVTTAVNPSTLTPQLELNTTGSFTGTAGTPVGITYTPSNISYSGSPITGATIGSVSGVPPGASTYYWKVRYADGAGRVSPWSTAQSSFKIDQTPPTGILTIDQGTYTKNATVNLTLSATDAGGSGISQMRFSNNGTNWADWETYATTKEWDVTNATYGGNNSEEEKTVYVQYRDNAGNVSNQFSFNEDFSTAILKDAGNTTANWDVGQVKLRNQFAVNTKATNLPFDSFYSSAVWRPDAGVAYIFGSFPATTSIIEYNPASSTSVILPITFPATVRGKAAVWDPNNKVAYIFGIGASYTGIYKFDPINGVVTTLAGTLTAISNNSNVVWDTDNRVAYICGLSGGVINKFDPLTGLATDVGVITPTDVSSNSSVWDSANKVTYIFGGNGGSHIGNTKIYMFDPSVPSVVTLPTVLPISVSSSATNNAYFDPNEGAAYILGGYGAFAPNNATNKIIKFDPSSSTATIEQTTLPQIQYGGSVIYSPETGSGYLLGNAYAPRSIIETGMSYQTPANAQSVTLDSTSEIITKVTLVAAETLNGQTIAYQMSANGGTNWETVTSGVEYNFVNTGSDLRWKATLSTGDTSVTPELTNVAISYSADTISASITLDTTGPSNAEGTITRPVGAESFVGATTEEITWDNTKVTDSLAGLAGDGTTAITIQFTQNNGSTWSTVATGEANDGSYDWATPNTSCVSTCRIAILATDKAGNTSLVTDPNTTSGLFSITSDSQAPIWDAGTVLDVSNTKYVAGATTWTDATPTLSWTPAPTDPAPGSGIASYEVIYEGGTPVPITGITTTEATPTLAEGTYEWYVNAIDGAGLEANTKDAISKTKTISVDATAPNGTLNLISLTGTTATNSCTIAINLSDQVEVGSGIQSIQYSNDQVIWSSLGEGSTWDLCSVDSAKGTKTVYVRMVDNVSNQRILSNTILYENTLPTNPTTVTATLVENLTSTYSEGTWTGNSSISITWSGQTDPEPNSSGIASYVIYRSTDDGAYAQVSTDTAAPYVDTARIDGHNYKYLIEVIDNAGNHSLYNVGQGAGDLTLADITNPEPPVSFSATGTDSTSIAVSWNSAPENSTSNGGKANTYVLSRTGALGSTEPTTENGTCSTNTYSSSIGSYTFEQGGVYDVGNDRYTVTDTVTAEQWYYYRILAQDTGGRPSSYTCYKARGNFAPEFPQGNINLAISNGHTTETVVPGDTVTVTFTATDFDGATDLDTGNAKQAIKIQDGALAEVLAYTDVTSKVAYNDGQRDGYTYTYIYTVPSGAKYGTYTVTINVADSVAVGLPGDNFHNQTKQVSFKVPVPTLTGFAATGYTSTSVKLDWDVPANLGLRATNTYSVERKLSSQGDESFAHVAFSNTNTYTNSGLAVGTDYTYRVRAYDVSSNPGAYSINSNAVPPAPASPGAASVKDASHTTISLGGTYPLRYLVTWDAVTNSAVPDFKGYKVYRSTNDVWEGSPIASIDCDTLGENQTYYLDLHTSADEANVYKYRVQTWDEAGNEGNPTTTLATNASVTPQITAQPTVTDSGVSWIKVSWKSNQSSYGIVDYKKTSDSVYNIAGTKESTTVQDGSDYVHTITIRGLEKGTQYNIRARSVNTSNAMSADSGTIIASTKSFTIQSIQKNITASGASISWNTTGVSSRGYVEYKKGNEAPNEVGTGKTLESHDASIDNLTPGDYVFTLKNIDTEGNIATSSLQSFTITGFDTGTLSSPKAGKIEEQDITATSAKITWTSTVSTSSWVDYGTESKKYLKSTGSDTLTIDHIVTLEGLTPGQTYYYIVRGVDANETEYKSQEYSFVALAKPNISNVTISDITAYTAKVRVTVTKDVEASVSFGNNSKLGNKAGSTSLSKTHEIKLENLEDASTYTYYVDVKDSVGNTARSETKSFTTPMDKTGPLIKQVKIDILPLGESDEYAQAIISWSTDKPSTTKVEYDEGVVGGKYTKGSIEDESLNNSHTVIIKDLNPASSYHFRIVSRDKRSNETKSNDYNFVTPTKEKSILQLILKSLEETFSWVRNVGSFFSGLGKKG